MRENTIERSLVRKGKKRGIEFLKFKTPSRRNVPDRITFLDNGITVFIECKRPGEDLRIGQKRYCGKLIAKGHRVYVLDNLQEVDIIIEEIIRLSEDSHPVCFNEPLVRSIS